LISNENIFLINLDYEQLINNLTVKNAKWSVPKKIKCKENI
jgi:hypothetical protein